MKRMFAAKTETSEPSCSKLRVSDMFHRYTIQRERSDPFDRQILLHGGLSLK